MNGRTRAHTHTHTHIQTYVRTDTLTRGRLGSKNPFDGEYTIFAGLGEVLAFIKNYKFTEQHIAFLREQMPTAGDDFFEYLGSLDCSQVKVCVCVEGVGW